MKTAGCESVRYEFVGYGQTVGEFDDLTNRLYLDVGNDFRIGVIDHHSLAAHSGSAARLVLRHPELIQQAVQPALLDRHPLTIVLHEHPDLDCIASAYLATTLLATGDFPAGAEALAAFVDRVDAGHPGMSLDAPFSLYAACMIVAHRLALRTWNCRDDLWRQQVADATRVVDFVVQQAARSESSIFQIDAFACPGLFGPPDREQVRSDISRYRQKLASGPVCARQLKLRLPGIYGGTSEVDTLLVREVQNPDDPQRVVFFKDWARTDREASAGSRGFAALCVSHFQSTATPPRTILSVAPDSGVSLQGLGAVLEEAEAEARIRKYGVDDRDVDPATGRKKEPRWRGANSDPWYDGRGHNYTIVDSPRGGTLLSVDHIEDLFVQYGRRAPTEALPLVSPQPEDIAVSKDDAEQQVRCLTFLRQSTPSAAVQVSPAPPEIFISYPRSRMAWVEEHVYDPLRSWRGAERVFFDRNTLNAGEGWLARLADGVDRCRVFLPVYCSDYFRRPFCQWELQLAVIRDPVGQKRIILPLIVEPVELPAYCRLIQGLDLIQRSVMPLLRGVLDEILST